MTKDLKEHTSSNKRSKLRSLQTIRSSQSTALIGFLTISQVEYSFRHVSIVESCNVTSGTSNPSHTFFSYQIAIAQYKQKQIDWLANSVKPILFCASPAQLISPKAFTLVKMTTRCRGKLIQQASVFTMLKH
jgi:hypothetical protein